MHMLRALIVEDEDLMREYLAAKLTELSPAWGSVTTAADGMEAAERMAHERFDAVVTDIRMPGMDGLELARYIRRADAELPILIISGYDAFDYARAAVRLNVFDYLLKPLNEAELAAALDAMAALAARRRTAEGETGLLAALTGDEAALTALRQKLKGKPCGLLALAPAYAADRAARAEAAQVLQGEVQASFMHACDDGNGTSLALCPADDALLVETECRAAATRLVDKGRPLPAHCGYAALDMASTRASLGRAMAALRLALALGEPMLGDQPLNQQRQAQARLEAMQSELDAALAAGTMREERCAALVAALQDFAKESRYSVALSLLWQCAAGESEREAALQIMQPMECSQTATPGKNSAKCDACVPPTDIRPQFAAALAALFAGGDISQQASGLTQRAADYLRLHFAEPVSLAALAEHLRVTPAYLSALFHREMGRSYSQYLLMLRMEDAARRLLADPAAKVHAVGEAVGFPAAKHFTHVFGQYFGLSPRDYREQRGKA